MTVTLEFNFPDELDTDEVNEVLRDLVDVHEVEQAAVEMITGLTNC